MKADVSKAVRQLRALQGWTQTELAARIPVSLPTVQRWEAGRPVRQLGARQKLAELLGEVGLKMEGEPDSE